MKDFNQLICKLKTDADYDQNELNEIASGKKQDHLYRKAKTVLTGYESPQTRSPHTSIENKRQLKAQSSITPEEKTNLLKQVKVGMNPMTPSISKKTTEPIIPENWHTKNTLSKQSKTQTNSQFSDLNQILNIQRQLNNKTDISSLLRDSTNPLQSRQFPFVLSQYPEVQVDEQD